MKLGLLVLSLVSIYACKTIDLLAPVKPLLYDVNIEKNRQETYILNPKKQKFRIKICHVKNGCQTDYFSSETYPIGNNVSRVEISQCTSVDREAACSGEVRVIDLKDSGPQTISLSHP